MDSLCTKKLSTHLHTLKQTYFFKEKAMNKTHHKKQNPIDLTQDWAFKQYFKGSKTILISLLQQFLPLDKNRKIQSVEILDPELSSEKNKKNPILDLRVHLDNKETVNIEMQSVSKKDFKERVLFYLAKLYTWNLKSGEDYRKVYPAYSLVFTNFTVFKELEEYSSVFQLRADQNSQVVFSRNIGIVLVELNKFKKEDLKSFDLKDLWCYLIKNAKRITKRELSVISERGSVMREAAVRIRKLSKEESELMYEEAMEKQRWDRAAERAYAREVGLAQGRKKGLKQGRRIGFVQGRDKGIEQGIKEGIEQGIQKGIEQGRAKGKEEGREEGKEEGMELVALNMLKNKTDIDFIVKMTGLSQSKIFKLKKNLK